MFTPYLWLGAIVLFCALEAATLNFTSIWFALGAVAGFFASLLKLEPLPQFAIFTVVSALALILTRPLVKKLLARRPDRTNADRNVGRTAQVLTAVAPGQPGRVRLDGVDWTAVSEYTLQPGENCRVTALESTTLTVVPLTAGAQH